MQKAAAMETQISRVMHDLVTGMCAKQNRDKVKINETNMTRSVTISACVDSRDYGKIIGSGARNFRALELIVKMLAAGEGKEGIFSVVPPRDKTPAPADKFKPATAWGMKQLQPLVDATADAIFSGTATVNIAEPDPTTCNIEILAGGVTVYDGSSPSTPKISTDQGTLSGSEAVSHALKTVFHAIGKNNGKNVYMTFVPNF